MKLIVKNIHFKGTEFASYADDERVRKAIAEALNSVEGADTFGRPFTKDDVWLLEEENSWE